MIKRSTAVLAVTSVTDAARFYTDVLGLRLHWLWGEPATFGSVGDGHVELFLNLDPTLAARSAGHQVFFHVDDLDGLYERQRAAGATIASPLERKPWGIREYTVRDPDGYLLRFGGADSGPDRPPTATESLPPHVRIEPRLATSEEYGAITQAVGWNKDEATMPDALERSAAGVVAVDARDGRAIGMLRITGDGRYFMIWDVMILPEYQGQKIGSAMMEAAMAELRRIGKRGAFVGLFTAKTGFYERFGFRLDGGMHTTL
jgi:catechol 2,3-dioxygenase-like lactoylglutathione lyase family enzyme/GNAT superfamily N-acetyltransferase